MIADPACSWGRTWEMSPGHSRTLRWRGCYACNNNLSVLSPPCLLPVRTDNNIMTRLTTDLSDQPSLSSAHSLSDSLAGW